LVAEIPALLPGSSAGVIFQSQRRRTASQVIPAIDTDSSISIHVSNAGAETAGVNCAVVVTVAVHGEQVPFADGVVVATLVMLAGGVVLTVAVTVYVAELPTGKVAIVSPIAPVPLAAHVAPPLPTQVHVWLAMPVGTGSLTVVPSATTTPLLVTVTV